MWELRTKIQKLYLSLIPITWLLSSDTTNINRIFVWLRDEAHTRRSNSSWNVMPLQFAFRSKKKKKTQKKPTLAPLCLRFPFANAQKCSAVSELEIIIKIVCTRPQVYILLSHSRGWWALKCVEASAESRREKKLIFIHIIMMVGN